jgi:hypothetical protein
MERVFAQNRIGRSIPNATIGFSRFAKPDELDGKQLDVLGGFSIRKSARWKDPLVKRLPPPSFSASSFALSPGYLALNSSPTTFVFTAPE